MSDRASPHPPGWGFPATVRLKTRSEYLEVQKNGRRLQTDRFLVLALARPGQPMRLGITVSRKVANAVGRSRVKRLVREAFRRGRNQWPEGWDVVIVARRECLGATYAEISASLSRGLGRLRPVRSAA